MRRGPGALETDRWPPRADGSCPCALAVKADIDGRGSWPEEAPYAEVLFELACNALLVGGDEGDH